MATRCALCLAPVKGSSICPDCWEETKRQIRQSSTVFTPMEDMATALDEIAPTTGWGALDDEQFKKWREDA